MIYPKESLLRKTNQTWKLNLSILSSLLAFVFIGFNIANADFGIERIHTYYLIGVLATIGMFLNFSIKCPKCGSRWLMGMTKYPTKYQPNENGIRVQKYPRCGLSSEDVT